MKKRVIFAALITAAAFSFSANAATDMPGESNEAISAARDLFNAGLMKGNSGTFSVEAFELDRPATRVEIAITITRMLGKETKALYQQNAHPFTDVPDWASAHIGWLYENYLVNGVSDTLFGSNNTATTRQFCTMLLRVLGYSEAKGEFSYNNATEAAQTIGLITTAEASQEILYRSNMAVICRRALQMPLKNAFRTLSQKLRDDRAITKEQFDTLNPVQKSPLDAFFAAYPQGVANGRAYYDTDKIVLQMEDNIGDFGLRVFYTSDQNTVPIELPLNNTDSGFVKATAVSPFSWYKQDTLFCIYGLQNQTNVKFKVVDSSSEDILYYINKVSPTIDTKNKNEWIPYTVSLTDFFNGYPVNVSGGKITRNGSKLKVSFSNAVMPFGLRAVYTSDQTTYPKELPFDNSTFGFTKGTPDYSIGGYIHDITIHGLQNETNVKICVVETSSEGPIYLTKGVSPVIEE